MTYDPSDVAKARRILSVLLYMDVNGDFFIREPDAGNEVGLPLAIFTDTLKRMQCEVTFAGFIGFDSDGNPRYERIKE